MSIPKRDNNITDTDDIREDYFGSKEAGTAGFKTLRLLLLSRQPLAQNLANT